MHYMYGCGMVKTELRYECITSSYRIDECRITEYFSGYIFNFVKLFLFHFTRHDAGRRAVRSPERKHLERCG
ncbi:hypothetical protein TNCV_972981 [Trichonephila clavipes]|nr:hypothetical protein TNCV_972981 [Trichonephila clavipes]